MSDQAPHNPYVPEDELDPEHPRPETAGSHEAQSPINKAEIDLEASPLTAPPPSGTPVATDDPNKPVTSTPPVIEPDEPEPSLDQTGNAPIGGDPAVDGAGTITEEPTQAYAPPIASFDPPPPPPPVGPIAPVPSEPQRLADDVEGTDKVARIIAGAGSAIAVIVLILLLAGVPSHKVKTSDIANDAVTGPKIAPNAVSKSNLAPGTAETGPAGPKGATGPAGPKGATGPRGPAGASGLQTQTVSNSSSLDADTSKSVIANCPDGQTLAFGGASISGSPDVVKNIVLQSSGPFTKGKDAWTATAVDLADTPSGSWQLTVTIGCSEVPPSDATHTQSPNSKKSDNVTPDATGTSNSR